MAVIGIKEGECCYILGDRDNFHRCSKPTKYKIEKDDDGNKHRVYDVFCPEHREFLESEEPDEWDEDEQS